MRDIYLYYFQAEFPGHATKNHAVSITERPQLLVEELVDSNGNKQPGKTRWLPLTTKYFWPEEVPDEAADLFNVLSYIYHEGACSLAISKHPEELMTKIAEKLGKGVLSRYHKQSGEVVEEWHLRGLWPHSVNFGELCYSSRADVEIEVVWRFLEAEYKASPIS